MTVLRSVCVFCGSSFGVRPQYKQAAEALARELARSGIALVYGGGNIGLMGVVADAALAAGVHVTGVIPQALADSELAHYGVSDLRVVESMHARKALMADLSDGFIAMPGGIGTFEEWFEILTWNQLGIHRKPCGLLDVEGYYQDLLRLLDRAQSEGFYKAKHRRAVLIAEEPAALLDLMRTYEPAAGPSVIDKIET
ncbi:MAG TPA: TIGR00730 family Rossman fold protein [Candidatus Limnocylindrales bacterium]|nr:TIGR00730 family Rossman fold protein [Candidatus Limnocylindrales bacterium]